MTDTTKTTLVETSYLLVTSKHRIVSPVRKIHDSLYDDSNGNLYSGDDILYVTTELTALAGIIVTLNKGAGQ